MFLEASRLRFVDARQNFSRKVKQPAKEENNLQTWRHEGRRFRVSRKRRPLENEDLENEDPLENEDLENEDP